MFHKCNYMHSIFSLNHIDEMSVNLDEDTAISQILGPSVIIPPRVFTLYELANYYNGQNGTPAYVSANGLVFDITNSAAWATGTHFSLVPGYDYSVLFTTYHGNDFIEIASRVPIVGRIIYPCNTSSSSNTVD